MEICGYAKERGALSLVADHVRSVSIYADDLASLIEAAGSAGSVGEGELSALGAFGEAGHVQLPDIAAALVASGLGHLTLGYCHGVHLLGRNRVAIYPLTAVQAQPVGDRDRVYSHRDLR